MAEVLGPPLPRVGLATRKPLQLLAAQSPGPAHMAIPPPAITATPQSVAGRLIGSNSIVATTIVIPLAAVHAPLRTDRAATPHWMNGQAPVGSVLLVVAVGVDLGGGAVDQADHRAEPVQQVVVAVAADGARADQGAVVVAGVEVAAASIGGAGDAESAVDEAGGAGLGALGLALAGVGQRRQGAAAGLGDGGGLVGGVVRKRPATPADIQFRSPRCRKLPLSYAPAPPWPMFLGWSSSAPFTERGDGCLPRGR